MPSTQTPLRIVLLDDSTLHANHDLDLSGLERFGPCTHYPQTEPTQLAERIQNAEVILTNKVRIDAPALEAAKNLKLICVCATGTDIIDLTACQQRGIAVCNVAGYSTESVAQHVFCLILNLSTKIHRYATEANQWPTSEIFTRLDHPISELHGKTLGIVGFGTIGRAVARIGAAFGLRPVALASQRPGNDGSTPEPSTITRLDESEFFSSSDIVSLHCPLNQATKHFIDSHRLAKMKSGALLINTGRGLLIDSTALRDALSSGHLGGAGLDVLESEPPTAEHPLLGEFYETTPNLIITPHTAWASYQARERLIQNIHHNIQAYLDGQQLNRIV